MPSANTQNLLSDPPGVDEGLPWGLYGSIGVSVYRDSNPLRTTGGSQKDTAIIIPASLTYKQRFGRHQAHLRFSSVFGRYDKLSTEDFEDYTIDGAVLFDLTRSLDVGLFAAYTEAHEQRGASGTPLVQLGDRNKIEALSYGGDIFYGRRGGGDSRSKMYVGGGVRKDEWRYTNNGQSFRDRDYETIYARAGYRPGTKTDIYVELRNVDISYLQSPVNQDSTEESVWLGVAWKPTAAISGDVKVGRIKKDFDNPAFDDKTTTAYAARVNWTPRQRHSFNFWAARSTEEGIGASTYYISEVLGARWNYDFGNNWRFYAYGTQTQDDFSSGRSDEITEYGAGVNKSLTRWLSFLLGYSHIERTSNLAGAEYDANLFTVGLTANISGKIAGPGVESQRAQ